MKFRLLGTGAADGIPSLFYDDEVSRFARLHGGKDVRTRTSALIDDEILIDLGPDLNAQVHRSQLDPSEWSAVIFTHSDDDHVQVNELQYALYPFTDREFMPFTIYANEVVLNRIARRYPEWPMELVLTHSFRTFQHGGHRITPIRARHIDSEDCQNLLIQTETATALYASDTGVPYDETFEFLQDHVLDLLILECTDGFCPQPYDGHLDIEECQAVVDRLRRQGTVSATTQVFTTHHSIRGKALHHQLEEVLGPHGIHPGFDGQIIEINRA